MWRAIKRAGPSMQSGTGYYKKPFTHRVKLMEKGTLSIKPRFFFFPSYLIIFLFLPAYIFRHISTRDRSCSPRFPLELTSAGQTLSLVAIFILERSSTGTVMVADDLFKVRFPCTLFERCIYIFTQ
jgi:hypothetical protein